MYTAGSAEAVSTDIKPELNPFSAAVPEADSVEIIIRDAFEAATNGMHNPEALNRLNGLDDDDEVKVWKSLIAAIISFYNQDFKGVGALLSAVPDDSPAGRLKPALLHMSGLRSLERRATYHEEKLIKKITEDSRFLASAIAQLNDSIEYGGELFAETASLLIKEIKSQNQNAAARLTLWCFSVCFSQGFDEEPLADNVLMLFGQAEGLRLIALSLMEDDPESALICFTRSLIKRIIDKTIKRDEAAAMLDIIDVLMSACEPEEPLITDISELLTMLDKELEVYFSLGENFCPASAPSERINGMKQRLSGSIKPPVPDNTEQEKAEKRPAKKAPAARSTEAVQLELF